MRVLVACEFSGVVRNAFRERGHDAWSCDILEAEDDSTYHLRCNALNMLGGTPVDRGLQEFRQPWDLLIAHPPCTYLTNSGVRWLYKEGRLDNGRDEQRWRDLAKAALFFRHILEAPIPRVCVENPIMHGYARELIEADPAQIIQPWQFGHGEIKATGLWLKNLPPLVPTNIVEGRQPRVHHASPGPDRWKERSRTLAGIATAMADQWSVSTPSQDRS